jgi:formylglycine-generating enzyme required for sulfatase activity
MPCRDEPPEAVRSLARRNSARPTPERFQVDAQAVDAQAIVKAARRGGDAPRNAEAKWRVDREKRPTQVEAEFLQRTQDPRAREPNAKQPEYVPRQSAAAARADAIGVNREPEPAWQPPRRALPAVCVLGVVLAGSIGVWLAGAYRTPIPSEATAVDSSPASLQALAAPVAPASSGLVMSLPGRERVLEPKDSSKDCNNCAEMAVVTAGSFTGSAVLLSPEHERTLQPKDSFKECSNCPEMVVMPAGRFTMGSPDSEQGHNPDESPQHSVTFASQFAVGRFAVTFDEWDACVADGGCNGYQPSDQGWGRGRRPVTNVSWDDAKAYVAWLSKKTGKPYRLLSEAEREYATRAGTTSPFWWGSSISTSQANYDGDFTYGDGTKDEYRGKTVPVDSFQPNPRGLYQVHGNLYDWVEDCYHDGYRGAPSDGSAWISEDCSLRVVRGGSWIDDPRTLRSAYRLKVSNVFRFRNLGFRVARTLAR